MGSEDMNIKVSDVQANATGRQVTASVQILSSTVAGTRQIHLETDQGEVLGMMSGSLFTITKVVQIGSSQSRRLYRIFRSR